jgi:hypothetical protein
MRVSGGVPVTGQGADAAGPVRSDQVDVMASTSEQVEVPPVERLEPEPPVPASPREPGPRRRPRPVPRRTRVVVRKVQPWSVLKFSLLFYFCLMLVVMFALMIVYWIMGLTGVLDSLGRILQNAGFGPQPGKGTFRFDGVWMFERLFLIGAIGVVVWSLVNLLVAVLYNLVSDVVGGVSITLTEKR